ncbi:MAG: TIGR04282 family arsenosugar biosynthesis glycosyltransferase [Acidimicrobiia bacterium]
MIAPSPRHGRAFWLGLVLGGGVIAYGIAGTLAESDRTQPDKLARWVIGSLLVHDLMVAPLVCLVGLLVARTVPGLVRAPVQAGLMASAIVVAVATPGLASLSDRPGNPTVHPIDYRTATLVVLGTVWAIAGAWFLARARNASARRARRVTLAVIAKAPCSGRSKTRLCPPCTPAEAARLARAALEDTLAAMAAAPVEGRRVAVLDGRPGSWLPPGFEVVPQRDGDLGDRLAAAFVAVGAPALVVAMDTPQVTPELLAETVRTLDRPGTDAVLGPTDDGGYWVIGLRRPDPRVFDDVPMSSPGTLDAQRARLRDLGLTSALAPRLRDVDDFEDALAVARAAPDTRFASTLREIGALKPG